MVSSRRRLWMIRAGFKNALAEKVYKQNAIAIGWKELGDLAKLKTREEVREEYNKLYPNDTPGRANVMVSQIYRFVWEVKVEDIVITFLSSKDKYLLGTIKSDYVYDSNVFSDDYPHVRHIEWFREIDKSDLSAKAKTSLGSILTVFNVDKYLKEILSD